MHAGFLKLGMQAFFISGEDGVASVVIIIHTFYNNIANLKRCPLMQGYDIECFLSIS